MATVTIPARDGTCVDIDDNNGEPPKSGGIKDVYFTPDKKYAVAFFRKKIDIDAEDRLIKIVGAYRRQIFEHLGGSYFKTVLCWPERIVDYGGKTGIVVPRYDKRFYFPVSPKDPGEGLGGLEKEGKWFTSAKNLNRFVPPGQKGDLRGFLAVCLTLSRGVRKIHQLGLAHSDLSYKNCLVDPLTGSACIIDIDGLVVPGLFPPDVIGTPDFIAPEVVATMHLPADQRRLPCRETDQHALAVLIYEYLFHRHPLEGDKVYDTDPAKQSALEMGEKALFIEHPRDPTNRKKVHPDDSDFLPWIDTNKLPYTIAGKYLRDLFDKAFVTGLHNPMERPSANDWEIELDKTLDILVPCHNKKCPMKWYVFLNTPKPACPYCGAPYRGVLPLIDFYSKKSDKERYLPEDKRLMVHENQYLHQWHVNYNVFPNELLDEADKKPAGYFALHRGKWFLVNQTLTSLLNVTDRANQVFIPPNSKVELVDGLTLSLSSEEGGRVALVRLVRA